MEVEEPVRIFVHPELHRELISWKNRLEGKLNYKLAGGTTAVSEICAKILKQEREKTHSNIKIEFRKRTHSQKCDMFFL